MLVFPQLRDKGVFLHVESQLKAGVYGNSSLNSTLNALFPFKNEIWHSTRPASKEPYRLTYTLCSRFFCFKYDVLVI